MKYEKFKIANLIKEWIINVDKNLTNFPIRYVVAWKNTNKIENRA